MDLGDLPAVVQQFLAQPVEERREALAAFSLDVQKKREQAVIARKASGIEAEWMKCEEQYVGIDAVNRSEFSGARWAKPTSMDGPLTQENGGDTTRSTAYVRVTARYVDAGAAKLSEIALSVDERSFGLTATPDPDLTAGLDDDRRIIQHGVPVIKPAAAAELPTAPGAPTTPAQPAAPLTVADLAQHHVDAAHDSAKLAADRIYDWMVKSGHQGEMRKVIFDGARLGVGILKGPVPDVTTAQVVKKVGDAVTIEIEQKIVPVTKWVDPWNFFPDDACGEDIHAGGFTFERDFLSEAKLEKLKGQPGYMDDAIDAVVKEGPGKINTDGQGPSGRERMHGKRFEIWYYYGAIKLGELSLANQKAAINVVGDRLKKTAQAGDGDGGDASGLDPANDPDQTVFAIVTMVNDTVIRTVVNPLESGSFPYHVWCWRRRPGHWAGVGVAEQCRLPESVVNSGTRRLLDNAGLSSGSQIIINRGLITPADGTWNVTPDKAYYADVDDTNLDVRQAFLCVAIPNMTPQLMTVIQFGFKLAEESTSIPLITQGQSGGTTPDTFGAAQIQNNNANQLLRDVGYGLADRITNPCVQQHYEWLLLDPDVPAAEKGSFSVNTNAAAAMIDRAIQNMEILQMAALVGNPAFGIDPKRYFAMLARSKRLDPRDFQYTPEELKAQAAVPPAPPLPVLVEQTRGQNALQLEAARTQAELQLSQQEMQAEQQRLQSGGTTPHMAVAQARIEVARITAEKAQAVESSRAQTELIYAQTEAQMARDNQGARRQEAADKRELMILEYALKSNLTLAQVKAQLAQTAMVEQTKRELAGLDANLQASENHQNRMVDLHKHLNPVPEPMVPAE